MSAARRLAHLRPVEIRALVVIDGVPVVTRISSAVTALRALVGGPHSFLLLTGGPAARGVILLCNAKALNAVAQRLPPTANQIARALGHTVAVGPATLRDGSTVWTSLTDDEVEFWSVALRSPTSPRKGNR